MNEKNKLCLNENNEIYSADGSEVTPEMIFGEKDDGADSLKALLDDPSELPIDKFPPPEGTPKDVVDLLKEPKVDSGLYNYENLANKVLSMPEAERVSTGLEDLDELLDGGLQGGELMILSAPTKMGKTSICQTMSFLQALDGKPSIWFTLEMSWQELTRKFMEMDYGLEMTKSPSKLPIFYPVDNRELSLEWLEKQIKKAIKVYGAKVVYIDHLHFLVPMESSRSNISFLVGSIVRGVKQIAVRLEIPIVLITHTKKMDVSTPPDINSPRDCLPGSALVYSNGERVRVDKLKPGMEVVARRSLSLLQKDKVKDVWETGEKNMLEITTKTGRKLVCSTGHKLFATTYKKTDEFGPNQGAGIAGWTRADELVVKQKVLVPAQYPEVNRKKTISEAEAVILGWIIGDGYVCKEQYTEITVNTKEEVNLLNSLCKEAWNIKPNYTAYEDKNAYRFYLSNGNDKNHYLDFIRRLKYNGVGENKYVPEEIFLQPNSVVAKLLVGLFHADGNVSRSGNCEKYESLSVRLDTISERLARDVQHLLLRFGIISYLRKCTTASSGYKTDREFSYVVQVRSRDVDLFVKHLGFLGKKQEKLLEMFSEWGFYKNRKRREVLFDRITSIKELPPQKTYDIEVVGNGKSVKNNSFCVDDFITHNSSFIVQESDFTLIMWRQRAKKEKKRGESNDDDDSYGDEVYTDKTFLSLEANRRNGKTRKMCLGFINGRFHGYNDYTNLKYTLKNDFNKN